MANKVADLLMQERRRLRRSIKPREYWPWIGKYNADTITRRAANSFVLYCIIEYRLKPQGRAVENATRFIASQGNPVDIWDHISTMRHRCWEVASLDLHWLEQARVKVRLIAQIMVNQFAGDARNIWTSGDANTTLAQFRKGLTLGPQLSRMAVLGLRETGYVSGPAEAKADSRVCRVLGRVVRARSFSQQETSQVHEYLTRIDARNSWKLDLPLYEIGGRVCHDKAPDCLACPLVAVCRYASERR